MSASDSSLKLENVYSGTAKFSKDWAMWTVLQIYLSVQNCVIKKRGKTS